MKGGFGVASIRRQDTIVAAAAVVNAVGDIVKADANVLAGARDLKGGWLADQDELRYVELSVSPTMGTNTTLVLVVTNATLSRSELARITHQAHNGIAITVRPSHTRHDGDIAFALTTRQTTAPTDLINRMVVHAVSEAIRSGVRHSRTVADVPGLGDLIV